MARKNLFEGEGHYVQLVWVAYKRLKSREWVSYASVMADYLGLPSARHLPCAVSKCDYYGELKKAFRTVLHEIVEAEGEGSVEEIGNNRNKQFRYVGMDNDPLSDLFRARVIHNLRQYWQFCQDSSGFFPTAWLEYYFKDCQDLLDIREKQRKGEQVLTSSMDRQLTNIGLLPFLYEAIVRRQVLSVRYQPYEEELRELTFHPHYLREYNGRWFLFGHAEGCQPETGFIIALDRIVGKVREVYGRDYVAAPEGYYSRYFTDIVGVTHFADQSVQEIRLRFHSYYVFRLIETKPLHPSQCVVVPFAEYEEDSYGEMVVRVEVNNELIGSILQMGAGIEVVAPLSVRTLLAEKAEQLFRLYRPG